MNKLRIKDKGYEVVFIDEITYLKHISSCQIKKFCVMIEVLYTFDKDTCTTLRSRGRIGDVMVERDHDLALKRNPLLVGSWANQEDDDEEDHLETSNRRIF